MKQNPDGLKGGARDRIPKNRVHHGVSGTDGWRAGLAKKILPGGTLEGIRSARNKKAEEEHQKRLAVSKDLIKKHKLAIKQHIDDIQRGHGDKDAHERAINDHKTAIMKHESFTEYGIDTLGDVGGMNGDDPHYPHHRAMEASAEAFKSSKKAGHRVSPEGNTESIGQQKYYADKYGSTQHGDRNNPVEDSEIRRMREEANKAR